MSDADQRKRSPEELKAADSSQPSEESRIAKRNKFNDDNLPTVARAEGGSIVRQHASTTPSDSVVRQERFASQASFVPGRDVDEGQTMHTSITTIHSPVVIEAAKGTVRPRLPFNAPFEYQRLVYLVLLLSLGVWSYWPSLVTIATSWFVFVDYSHGFLVVPLTLYFLWTRRDTYPGTYKKLTWIGLLPLLLCLLIRYRAALRFEDSLENWSLLLWLFGTVWFLYGTRVFLWALPSLLFLCFMIPLPYSFEYDWRQQLQEWASTIATMMLQTLAEPAVQLRNMIHLGTTVVNVAESCSGLRFLVCFLALASFAVLLMRHPWWQNIFVFLFALPIAIASNAARIVLTALMLAHAPDLLRKFTSEDKIGVLADQIAGVVMIIVAACIFLLMLWYLGKVFQRVSLADIAVAPPQNADNSSASITSRSQISP